MENRFDNNYLGKRVSLISKLKIRYEGTLDLIDKENGKVVLNDVRMMGTENREVKKYIKPQNKGYKRIMFSNSDIVSLDLIPQIPQYYFPFQQQQGSKMNQNPMNMNMGNFPFFGFPGQNQNIRMPNMNQMSSFFPFGSFQTQGQQKQGSTGQQSGQQQQPLFGRFFDNMGPGMMNPMQQQFSQPQQLQKEKKNVEEEKKKQDEEAEAKRIIEELKIKKKDTYRTPKFSPPAKEEIIEEIEEEIKPKGKGKPVNVWKVREQMKPKRKPKRKQKSQKGGKKKKEEKKTVVKPKEEEKIVQSKPKVKAATPWIRKGELLKKHEKPKKTRGGRKGGRKGGKRVKKEEEIDFSKEFDFENEFSKFDKEKLEQEYINNHKQEVKYEKDDFFDSLSTSVNERRIRLTISEKKKQEKIDTETFGVAKSELVLQKKKGKRGKGKEIRGGKGKVYSLGGKGKQVRVYSNKNKSIKTAPHSNYQRNSQSSGYRQNGGYRKTYYKGYYYRKNYRGRGGYFRGKSNRGSYNAYRQQYNKKQTTEN